MQKMDIDEKTPLTVTIKDRRMIVEPATDRIPETRKSARNRCEAVFQMLVEHFESVDDRGRVNAERKAIEFMRAHASVTIVIPSEKEIARLHRKLTIVRSISKCPSQGNAARLTEFLDYEHAERIGKCFKEATGKTIMEHRQAFAAEASQQKPV